jgi:phenylacetate-CoA ligase
MEKMRKLIDLPFSFYYKWQLRKDQWKDLNQLKEIQLKRLKSIIRYAYNFVPYYHELFAAAKIKPDDIKNLGEIRKIPMTSKQDVQENFANIIARGVDASKLPFSVTSGSTGIPLKVVRDYSHIRGVASVSSYILFERGVLPSDNFVTVWGRGSEVIQWGKKYVRLWDGINRTVVPLFPPAKLVNILRSIKLDVLDTYPSVLCTLANYGASGINPRIIFTGGEVVTQESRNIIKKTFGVEPFETYGSVEFGDLAFECNEHFGLHIVTNSVLIEFVDEDGEYVSPGERGEIVVTGLWNHVMPLIRYRIGDMGIPTDEKCPCGRSWPLIKSIQGRINDYLVLRDGRKISYLYLQRVVFHKILKENIFAISQYQLIQDRVDRLILKVVKGKEFNPEILEQIKRSLENELYELGENFEVLTEIVDEIPMGRTGKRRLFISKVA